MESVQGSGQMLVCARLLPASLGKESLLEGGLKPP